ncbi:MAG: ribosomal RNA small subunit methyltransferase A [Bacteriovoracaceae bacterium]|nr:ribosomal RNA small subunit methyltransferase A [Bacteriovoracaceae bacterium]
MKRVHANKRLGQHFLHDQKVIDEICKQRYQDASAIIEVGPGPGVLTKHLANHQLPMHVIEKDKRFFEHLSDFIDPKQITIDDCLKISLPELINKHDLGRGKIWLISNLPYNVGVPLTISFMKVVEIQYMTLMFQKEVGEKITPQVTSKNRFMGSLYALSQNYFECQKIIDVSKASFVPPPKVESIVLGFKRRVDPVIPLEEFGQFEQFLRNLFSSKRKQVKTVLCAFYSSTQVLSNLQKQGIDPKLRAETLSLAQVQKLYRGIKYGD